MNENFTARKKLTNVRKFDRVKHLLRRLEALVEVIIFVLVYYGTWRIMYPGELFPTYYGYGKYVLMGVYAALVYVLFYMSDSFQFGHLRITDVVVSQWIALFVVNFITWLQLSLIANVMVSVLPMILLYICDAVISMVCVYFFTYVYHSLYVPRNMMLVYGNRGSLNIKFKMDTRPDKYHVTETVSADEGLDTIIEKINLHDAVVLNDVPAEMRNDILKYCYCNQIRTYISPKISDLFMVGAEEITLFDTPLLLIKGEGIGAASSVIKRIAGIVLCLIALIPGLPIMALVALAIKIEDGGPVFFKQTRVTKDNRTFEIIKFRSMIVDAEKNGISVPAVDKDPRITKVGSFIRATRIDELPQIFNILKGDMCWVGPRPERVEHVEKYSAEIPEFNIRHKVKGGLTGYAQIYGKYNTTAYDKLRLDLMYIENYSLLLDIKLMVMTLQIMVRKESTEGFDKQDKMPAEEGLKEVAATESDE